jgi:ABC-type cobalamin/Fe3+-siderophores transport system ATPase subunit
MHRLGLGYGVELHSCGLATPDGRGFLFVGHSGAGKSTLGKQWVKQRGATILSDDRNVVTNDDRGFVVHGTPWHGEAGLAKNASAHLAAIFLIQHGDANETFTLESNRSSAELLSRSFVPWYRRESLDFTLTFLQRLTTTVPVYVFRCLPDQSAVEYLERAHAI